MENLNQSRILPGMDVVGSDGGSVGQVKEVHENDFLVDRPMARDVYIPFNACQSARGQVMLKIRSDQVNEQNWPAPEVFGLGGESQEGMDG
jgi:hypothetical protein